MKRHLEVTVDGRIHGVAENTPRGRRDVESYLASLPWRTAEVRPVDRFAQGSHRIGR